MESLKKNNEFLHVYRNGRSHANRYLVMYLVEAPEDREGRLGISVSKKVGNSVVRHRVKRLIRESCRLNCKYFKKGYDIVIVARTAAKGKDYSDIESALLHLARIHGLYETTDQNERDDLN